MKSGQRAWTRDELILVMNLYCRLPFGKLDQRTPEVRELAKIIDRTPGAVSFKLNNIASLDPSLRARGIKGAANSSKLDKEIWNEFYNNWDHLPYESEKLRAKALGTTLERVYKIQESELPVGRERERVVKIRVNQSLFREMIMAAYNETCCITGLRNRDLLIASHIRSWSEDAANRMNPRNGLALNSLHDRAFELGIVAVDRQYKILVSRSILQGSDKVAHSLLAKYHGKRLKLPNKLLPDPELLESHKKERFKD